MQKKEKNIRKNIPKFKTDEEAAVFLDQDLTDYLNAENFVRVRFELRKKDKSITLRIPDPLLVELKSVAEKKGVAYQKLIREAIELYLHRKSA